MRNGVKRRRFGGLMRGYDETTIPHCMTSQPLKDKGKEVDNGRFGLKVNDKLYEREQVEKKYNG